MFKRQLESTRKAELKGFLKQEPGDKSPLYNSTPLTLQIQWKRGYTDPHKAMDN